MLEPAPSCVIFNPAAGKGQARRLIARAVAATGTDVRLMPTTCAGHAEELAQAAAEQGYATVIAAGGDGTVHEVANGLLRANRPEVTLAVWPIGTAGPATVPRAGSKATRSRIVLVSSPT